MKKIILLPLIAFVITNYTNAQTIVYDTVTMSTSYSNNVWYSLENDEQGTQPVNNWDIALAATNSQSNELTTSALFNPKIGKLYSIPGSSKANFNTADTTGLSTWSNLLNSDTSWATGAFNRTPSLGAYDYGYGSYNTSNHSIEANRLFVIKYTNNSCRKLYITLNTVAGTYTLVSDKLDNSDRDSVTITIATYNTKNFLYYSLIDKTIVDREPVTSAWDITFIQYYEAASSTQIVTGVLQNVGVSVLEKRHVDKTTYTSYQNQTFSDNISTIGRDWKQLNTSYTAYDAVDSLVYFVKAKTGNIWKLVFTGATLSSTGKFFFTKEKLATVTTPTTTPTGIETQSESTTALLSIYPNPSSGGNTTIIYDFENTVSSAVLSVYDLTGKNVYSEKINNSAGLHTHDLNTSLLNSGIYFLTIEFDGKKLQQKLIIQ